jgi:hypothetical protein
MKVDLIHEPDEFALKEFNSYVQAVLQSQDWCLRDFPAMLVAEQILNVAGDEAHLIVCNRTREDTVTGLGEVGEEPTAEEIGASWDFWNGKVEAVKSLYTARSRPILEITYNDIINEPTTMDALSDFTGVDLVCEFSGGLGWADMLINSVDLDLYSKYE